MTGNPITATILLYGILLLFSGIPLCLSYLLIKALRKYIRSKNVRKEKAIVCKSLGDVLKESHLRYKMTQEFVAGQLGVSRQAVSKWENGTSDPSTSNLLALAKLYGIRAEALLQQVQRNETSV